MNKMIKNVLDNGLKVYINKLPNTHSVAIDLYIRAGSKYEMQSQNGITHFLEHLHFREMCNMSQNKLYYCMESLGTTLRAETSKDYLRFYMKIRPNYFEKGLEIFKSILKTYDWSYSAFCKEKKIVLQQINEKGCDFSILCSNNIFKDSKLAMPIMGTEETLLSFTREQISDYKNNIFNTNNMAMFISGNITEIDEINRILGDVPINKGSVLRNIEIPLSFGDRTPDILIENYSSDYIDVDIAFDINVDINNENLDIINCILGEGVGSRLQRVIRETECLTTDIYSWVERYEELAILHIEFTIHKDLFIKCIYLIVNILNDMKESINSEDLDVSLPFYCDNRYFYFDDPSELNFMQGYYKLILNTDFKICTLSNSQSSIEKLKNDCRRIFVPENLSVTILGNCKNIKKQTIRKVFLNLTKGNTGDGSVC